MRIVFLLLALGLAGGADAQRIVTLAPHLAELVYDAGAGDHLVATVAYSDYPRAAAGLPQVGDAFRIDLERLAEMAPDLVLAWSGGTPQTAIEEIERLGFRVLALRTESLADIADHLRVIGRAVGTTESAAVAAAAFEGRLADLRRDYTGREKVRVFYQIADRPLYTVGGVHSLSDAITLCGGINVFASLSGLAPIVSDEAVLGAAPEVMFTGAYPPEDGPGALARWTRWTEVPAVAGGHLYQLDASVMGRPTPRLLDGVERMCGLIDRAR